MGRLTKAEQVAREQQMWAMATGRYNGQFMSAHEIAEATGVTLPNVKACLNRVAEQANTQLAQEVARVKAEHLERLSYITDEYMRSWERSKKPKRTVQQRVQELARGEGSSTDVTTRVEETPGDPRFLHGATQTMEQIRKLLGITQIIEPDAVDPNQPLRFNDDERFRRITAVLLKAEYEQANERPELPQAVIDIGGDVA